MINGAKKNPNAKKIPSGHHTLMPASIYLFILIRMPASEMRVGSFHSVHGYIDADVPWLRFIMLRRHVIVSGACPTQVT